MRSPKGRQQFSNFTIRKAGNSKTYTSPKPWPKPKRSRHHHRIRKKSIEGFRGLGVRVQGLGFQALGLRGHSKNPDENLNRSRRPELCLPQVHDHTNAIANGHGMRPSQGSFQKLGVPYFGLLILRRQLCTILGSPIFVNSHKAEGSGFRHTEGDKQNSSRALGAQRPMDVICRDDNAQMKVLVLVDQLITYRLVCM